MRRKLAQVCLIAVALLGACLPARIAPMVQYSVSALTGGFFEYDLTVQDLGGSEPFSGLIILSGSSVFNLDDTSSIGAPRNWSSSAPLPGLVDNLFYFSLTPTADIPIGGQLSGFTFQSSTDPSSLVSGDFAIEAIGAISSSQIPLGDAVPIPEPAETGIMLLEFGAISMFAVRKHPRR